MNSFIKFFAPFVIIIISTTILQSQINWGDFREPDGILQRLTIDPRVTFNSSSTDNDDRKNLRSQLLSRYSLNRVKERQVINFNIQHDLVYDINKQSNFTETQNRILNDISISGDYTYYLKSRRGLFLRAQPYMRHYHEEVTNSNISNIYQIESRLVLGYGRLENVSTLYQAIRIDKNMYGNKGMDQEKLFILATALRSIDYNNALDTRMRTLENQAVYLQTLEDYGYDVSSYINIANAIDMFRFERPFLLQHGFEISAGLLPRYSNNGNDLISTASATYAIAINDMWHWSIRTDATWDILEGDAFKDMLSLQNNVSYIPTARTQVTFSQFYNVRTNSNALTLSLNASYFVSPQLNIFAISSYRRSEFNFFGTSSSRSFSHDMGLKYYFF